MTRYDLAMDTTQVQSDYREVKFKKKDKKKKSKGGDDGSAATGKQVRKQKKLLDELFPEPDQSDVAARYSSYFHLSPSPNC
jgi:hypothetical protein